MHDILDIQWDWNITLLVTSVGNITTFSSSLGEDRATPSQSPACAFLCICGCFIPGSKPDCSLNSLSNVLHHILCSLIVVYLFGLIITCLNNIHKYFLLKFLSFNQPHHILTLEQSSAGGGENSIDSCIYVYNGTKVGQVTIMCINISMHLLHTVLYTFPMGLIRRNCSTIKSVFWWWSFPLFSWP